MNIVKEKDLSFYKDLTKIVEASGEAVREFVKTRHPFSSNINLDLVILPLLLPKIKVDFLESVKGSKEE